MRTTVQVLLTTFLFLHSSCKPEASSPTAPRPVGTTVGEEEFARALVKSLTPPRKGIHWVEWDLTPEDHRMLEMACSSPVFFDRLLDRVAELPEPSFPGCFFWYSHEGMKDCSLGEDYVSVLAGRLMKEDRPKQRKATRDAIQWHSFHGHARKPSPMPFEKSSAAIVQDFIRRDEEDDRWYGVVQANYAPRYPEASENMWAAIRAEAGRQGGRLIVGAFETAFNGLRHCTWVYRERFLAECLRFLQEARDLENPYAAGWMLTLQFMNIARSGLRSHEVLEWESALVENATRARSQTHRGDAIQVLIAMGSPRAKTILNEWLRQVPPESVLDSFVRNLRIPGTGEKDLVSEIDHPRIRARLKIGKEVLRRNWNGEPSTATYLLEVLTTDPRPEMRQEALHVLANTLRDDPRDSRDDLPQGMNNTLDLLDIVTADPSPVVRRVLVSALKRYRESFEDLSAERLKTLNRLFESVK